MGVFGGGGGDSRWARGEGGEGEAVNISEGEMGGVCIEWRGAVR